MTATGGCNQVSLTVQTSVYHARGGEWGCCAIVHDVTCEISPS